MENLETPNHARFENYAGPQINTPPPASRLRAVSGFDCKAAQAGDTVVQRTGAQCWPNLKKEKWHANQS